MDDDSLVKQAPDERERRGRGPSVSPEEQNLIVSCCREIAGNTGRLLEFDDLEQVARRCNFTFHNGAEQRTASSLWWFIRRRHLANDPTFADVLIRGGSPKYRKLGSISQPRVASPLPKPAIQLQPPPSTSTVDAGPMDIDESPLPLRAPRPYQAEALQALTREFATHSRVLLVLPTGSGKTFVAAKWLYDHVLSRGGKVVWVAHRIELLEQACEAFLQLQSVTVSQISWWVAGRSRDTSGRVVLMSVGSAHNLPEMRCDVLVIDEAHHEPAEGYQRLQRTIQASKHLGLTATPVRLDEESLHYDVIAYQRTFMSLVAEGWLARPKPVVPQTGLSFQMDALGDDFSPRSLEMLDNPQRNQFIVDHWMRSREMYGKTLVFAATVDHALALTRIFKAADPSLAVDCLLSTDSTPRERRSRIERFRSGATQILVNCRVLTEGFDCPDVQTVMLARPTLSMTLYLQMVGRGTRTTPTKHSFHLVDFEDNLGRFQSQLVRSWVLSQDSPDPTPAPQTEAEVEEIEQRDTMPQWLQEDLRAYQLRLSALAGYVVYERENGREDGFLVHDEDDESFHRLWRTLKAAALQGSERELVGQVLDAAPSLQQGRLSLQGLIGAAIALRRGRARYVSLKVPRIPDVVQRFIAGTANGADEVESLARQLRELHAVIKFTMDEIDNTLVWKAIHERHGAAFTKAVKQSELLRGLRGAELRRAIDDVYRAHLQDTEMTSFEWERFVIASIRDPIGSSVMIHDDGLST